jgi:hypothetical protein
MSVYKGDSKKLSFVAFMLMIFVAGCGGSGGGGDGDTDDGSGSNASLPDNTVPTVTTMSPGEDTAGIGTNTRLTATFSEAMAPAGINTENFRLTDGSLAPDGVTLVLYPGTVSYDATNKIAVFIPTGGLAPNTRYIATVITGIKDLAGNPLTTDFAWDFVTDAAADSTAPSVIYTSAASVAINRKISATFSEEMNSLTLTPANFTVTGPGATAVSGTVTYHGGTAVFAPSRNFAANTAYTARITTGARDLAGNALPANVTWDFTTGTNPDGVAPVVASTDPANAEPGVAISRTINVSFNEPMNPATITTANFVVTGPGDVPMVGTVAFDASNNTATFTRHNHLTTPEDFHPTPVSYLDPDTTYTATLTTGAMDMAGNRLAKNLTWSFTTAP